MTLCILCERHPPIDGSHIVPNFFVRDLKRHTPVPFLTHSTNLTRVEQDGWKGPYLCAECEGKLSRWEGKLAALYRDVVAMRTSGAYMPIDYPAEVWLAVASIHFRWMHLARNSPLSRGTAAFDALYSSLRTACDTTAVVAGAHLYLAGLEKLSPPAARVPGINAYAFMCIDGFGFDYEDGDGKKHTLSCVKPPGLCLVASSGPLTNLIGRPSDVTAVALSSSGGSITPFPAPPTFLALFGADWDEQVERMQAGYRTFAPERLAKIEAWAASPGAPAAAAEWHQADLELLKAQE